MTIATLRLSAVILTILAFVQGWGAAHANEPVRLGDELGTPDWLSLGGSYRIRYETLDNPFRAGLEGSTGILVQRLLFNVRADFDGLYLGAELQDSRAHFVDPSTPLGTDDVNTFELLRAYAGWQGTDVFRAGDRLDLRVGRLTLNIASRRLAARQNSRNTVNAFTGFHGTWTGARGLTLHTFAVFPIDRRPNDRASLLENEVAFDRENFDRLFWAVHATQKDLIGRASGEFYVFGLHERDRPLVQSRNRRLVTPGLRFLIAPKKGHWDFDLETALQVGTSRLSSAPTDITDRNHLAGLFHIHVGYTFDAPWSPRLHVQYDLATGDGDPDDGRNGRFDTLFGDRSFELGPTGIHGALARSNLNSPSLRLEFKPGRRLSGYAAYRAVFLASSRDAHTTSRVRDASGASGSFVGQQIEGRLRFELIPGNIRLESGFAALFKGRFLKTAPNAPPPGDTLYFYAASTFTF